MTTRRETWKRWDVARSFWKDTYSDGVRSIPGVYYSVPNKFPEPETGYSLFLGDGRTRTPNGFKYWDPRKNEWKSPVFDCGDATCLPDIYEFPIKPAPEPGYRLFRGDGKTRKQGGWKYWSAVRKKWEDPTSVAGATSDDDWYEIPLSCPTCGRPLPTLEPPKLYDFYDSEEGRRHIRPHRVATTIDGKPFFEAVEAGKPPISEGSDLRCVALATPYAGHVRIDGVLQ